MGMFDRWRSNPSSFIEILIDPDTDKPFVLLPAERAFISNMFKLDTNGRLLYSDLIYAAPKKTGKTTFGAILTLTAILLFGGRNAEGFCAANDYEQAAGRVFEMIKRIIDATPFLNSSGVKITADKITFTATNSIITAIASDAASAAGGAPTISVFDELWEYRSERARRLWDEMVPTPTRKVSCRLVVTYAGFEGESELLLDLYKRGLQQPEIGPDLHAGDGLLCYWTHTPQAPWQDDAWIASMRRSLRPSQFLRMIENRWVSAESTFIDMQLFDECVDPTLRSVVADRSLSVWVGVDASVRRDSTALVAVAWSYKDQQVRLVNHVIIQPTADNPIDFESHVEQTLIDWRKRYNLQAVYFDPYQLISSAQRLTREGLTMFEYPQTIPNLTESSQNLFDLIKGRNLLLYPNADIRLAVSRAVAFEGSRGWRIGKDKTSHKIDVVIALGMAALAAVKREVGGGCTIAQLKAMNNDGNDKSAHDYDGSREWRDRRCPPAMTMAEWARLDAENRKKWPANVPPPIRDEMVR